MKNNPRLNLIWKVPLTTVLLIITFPLIVIWGIIMGIMEVLGLKKTVIEKPECPNCHIKVSGKFNYCPVCGKNMTLYKTEAKK